MSGPRPDIGLPIVEQLPSIDTVAMFLRLRALPHCLLLDSARKHDQLGRYSFLAADPFDFIEMAVSQTDSFGLIANRLAQHKADTIAELPPFQGGIAGLFSYDLHQGLERIP